MHFAERLNSVHKSYLVFEPNKSQERLILGLILFCYLYGRRFTTANAKWRKQQKYVAGYWWPLPQWTSQSGMLRASYCPYRVLPSTDGFIQL